jgi:hypothetical protein
VTTAFLEGLKGASEVSFGVIQNYTDIVEEEEREKGRLEYIVDCYHSSYQDRQNLIEIAPLLTNAPVPPSYSFTCAWELIKWGMY